MKDDTFLRIPILIKQITGSCLKSLSENPILLSQGQFLGQIQPQKARQDQIGQLNVKSKLMIFLPDSRLQLFNSIVNLISFIKYIFRYGPPRLDLFGPPQHYLDLFGPPVRESTDNCTVVIRGIGEEELYCGPGDKDPGDVLIPLRRDSALGSSHY